MLPGSIPFNLQFVVMLLFKFFTTSKVFCPVSLICFEMGIITAIMSDTAMANKMILIIMDFNRSPPLVDGLQQGRHISINGGHSGLCCLPGSLPMICNRKNHSDNQTDCNCKHDDGDHNFLQAVHAPFCFVFFNSTDLRSYFRIDNVLNCPIFVFMTFAMPQQRTCISLQAISIPWGKYWATA